MTFTDSPDWQEVAVSVPSAGAMPDAPDWQRTTVGPGGTPSGGGGGGDTTPPGIGGFLGWTGNIWPGQTISQDWSGGATLSSYVYLTAFAFPADATVNYAWLSISGGTLYNFSNYSVLGLYEASGPWLHGVPASFALVAVTASGGVATAYNGGVGSNAVPLTASAGVKAGKYYAAAALIGASNGASLPVLGSMNPATGAGFAAQWQLTSYTSAQYSSLPASLLAADLRFSASTPWMGFS